MPRKGTIETDPKTIESFLGAVKLGMSIKAACAYSGISEDAFFLWQRKAEKAASEHREKGNKYVNFVKSYKNARAQCQSRHLLRITQAADAGTWQASAWILERRFPEEYAAHSDVSMGDAKITVVSNVRKEGDGDGDD